MLTVRVCFYCVRFGFFSTKPRHWLGRTSPKWPVVCLMGRNRPSFGQSIDVCDWLLRSVGGFPPVGNCRVSVGNWEGGACGAGVPSQQSRLHGLHRWLQRATATRHKCTSAFCYFPSSKKGKGKGFPYSIPSVGPGADPGVQAVSLQVSHPPGGRLPLPSARPAVTSPAAEHHRPLAGTKLYCLVTEAHRCKQLA